MNPEFFIGFAVGTFVSFVISSVYFSVQWRRCWDENKALRMHPVTSREPSVDKLGDWGSALDGWVEDE